MPHATPLFFPRLCFPHTSVFSPSRDLTESVGTNTGIEVLGDYQLHDLVQLDQVRDPSSMQA